MTEPRHALLTPDGTAMPDPDDPLLLGIGALRDEVRGTEQRAADAAVGVAVEQSQQNTDRRARRFWLPLILLASIASSALTAIVVDRIYGPRLDALAASDAALTATDAQIEQLVADAASRADAANAELQARGLAPVPVAEPGQAPDADVLVDAAVAQVLASLPPNESAAPTAAQLAGAVAAYLRDNPVTPIGPTPAQIAEAVAAYLQVNPPRDGRDGVDGQDGRDGEMGPPPTAEQIQAALVEFLTANPSVLCLSGGTFALVEGVLTTGGTADLWVCVAAAGEAPPPDDDGEGGLLDLGG